MALLTYLEPGDPFPPTRTALEEPNGLLAAGGVLDTDTLLSAYRQGIFPWYEAPQPVLWWTPDPRSILLPADLHVSRSLRRGMRRRDYQLRRNTAFREVIQACAAPRARQRGTWIDSAMARAYEGLHETGWAHSLEVWSGDTLVGGLYGISIGRAFFGESMFSREPDTSKMALVALATVMGRCQGFIDCQIESEHLNSLGAKNIARVDFENRLQHTVFKPMDEDCWSLPEGTAELLEA